MGSCWLSCIIIFAVVGCADGSCGTGGSSGGGDGGSSVSGIGFVVVGISGSSGCEISMVVVVFGLAAAG